MGHETGPANCQELQCDRSYNPESNPERLICIQRLKESECSRCSQEHVRIGFSRRTAKCHPDRGQTKESNQHSVRIPLFPGTERAEHGESGGASELNQCVNLLRDRQMKDPVDDEPEVQGQFLYGPISAIVRCPCGNPCIVLLRNIGPLLKQK